MLMLSIAVGSGSASAGRSWCRVDPGLSIGGQEAHINVYADPAILTKVTGPTTLIVTVPVGKEGKTKLLYMDDGFGYSYDLVIRTSTALKDSSTGIDITVQAFTPAGNTMVEMQVELVPVDLGKTPTYAKGVSDKWIALKGKV